MEFELSGRIPLLGAKNEPCLSEVPEENSIAQHSASFTLTDRSEISQSVSNLQKLKLVEDDDESGVMSFDNISIEQEFKIKTNTDQRLVSVSSGSEVRALISDAARLSDERLKNKGSALELKKRMTSSD